MLCPAGSAHLTRYLAVVRPAAVLIRPLNDASPLKDASPFVIDSPLNEARPLKADSPLIDDRPLADCKAASWSSFGAGCSRHPAAAIVVAQPNNRTSARPVGRGFFMPITRQYKAVIKPTIYCVNVS